VQPGKFAWITAPFQTNIHPDTTDGAGRLTLAEARGDSVLVTFIYRPAGTGTGGSLNDPDCPEDRCHRWVYLVRPDGDIVLVEEAGAGLPEAPRSTPASPPQAPVLPEIPVLVGEADYDADRPPAYRHGSWRLEAFSLTGEGRLRGVIQAQSRDPIYTSQPRLADVLFIQLAATYTSLENGAVKRVALDDFIPILAMEWDERSASFAFDSPYLLPALNLEGDPNLPLTRLQVGLVWWRVAGTVGFLEGELFSACFDPERFEDQVARIDAPQAGFSGWLGDYSGMIDPSYREWIEGNISVPLPSPYPTP
jgi:hypothetical protein